ncbi:FAD binding domain-containing protein [Clohesyomyces aquaticus]|uniref:FAD binding domain-containing protein n=1 Tax=Clohesyomyces aquaticus TaxID=1231657 RepID=A0A1Y1ZPM1_9PLEO|nr:FAD binding domain-containing protein [Clohesyomyces aquaticus]
MKLHVQLFLPLLTAASRDHTPKHCTSLNSTCWPSPSAWSAFNASLSGKLLAPHPAASPCHLPAYNSELCSSAKQNWTSSDWRTAQPGAFSALVWELGPEGQCFINSTKEDPCQQGYVAEYMVRASSVSDIQQAVKWAAKWGLLLTVKNTGHDHLGRSSGEGSFGIWTHWLKGRVWHDSFTVKGGRENKGVPAVTLMAGEQWLDVYRDADIRGRIVVGGSARTVGAAGGWMTGGGHSPFSHFYGLGVDNVLEVEIVDANGEVKILNEYTDPEHFWAIRGGAGNAWGVIISVTYKTHPNPTHIQAIFAQYTTNDSTANREVVRRVLEALPAITEKGYIGYGTLADGPVGLILSQANATNSTRDEVLQILDQVGNVTGVETQAGTMEFPTWLDYCDLFLHDPNIATNIIDSSRLLTEDVLVNKTKELLDLMEAYPDMPGGFNFIGRVNNNERDKTSVHNSWKQSVGVFSMGIDWKDDAPLEEKRRKKLRGVEVSKRLETIVGKGSGTYVNEANPYEPNWKETFWGEKYDRLERIKRRVDPRGMFVCNRCVGGDIEYTP